MISDIAINQTFGLDRGSKPIHGIYNPLVTCCFLPADRLFIAAFHRKEQKQCHFVYDILENQLFGRPRTVQFPDRSVRNFPIKSFYSPVTEECYTFYRQGLVYTVDCKGGPQDNDDRAEKLEHFADNELGPMYLLFDRALVT